MDNGIQEEEFMELQRLNQVLEQENSELRQLVADLELKSRDVTGG